MDYSIIDIEADNLLDDVTKIHCMTVNQNRGNERTFFTLTTYDEIREFIKSEKTLICHNGIRYDLPVLEKILDIDTSHIWMIDTLGVSWYLYPQRKKHGLAEWGIEVGVEKPPIEDWSTLTLEEYIHRCEEDVKINTRIWDKFLAYLKQIYSGGSIVGILKYITFKLKCAKEQEDVKWKVDLAKVNAGLEFLYAERDKRIDALRAVMPEVTKYKIVSKPAKPTKKDGSISAVGITWYYLLGTMGLPVDHEEGVKVEVSREMANPGSVAQIKAWLFRLGWVPETFKYVKDKANPDNPPRKVEQLSLIDGSDLCPSVKLLYETEPNLQHLEGLFIVRHRIGILEGFLRDADENEFVRARVTGFTNTMRFMHTELVNLPTVNKPYGDIIRGCLIAPSSEHILCGSDMSSLEDSTKRHYMFYYDPEYVKEMMIEGFDPHLDIAIQGNMLTPAQVEAHKAGTEDHGKIRKDAKVVNFSAVYGVGAPKMSLTTKWPLSKSKQMLEVYWKRNWAVKRIAKDCTVKTVQNQMWLYNAVSGFWYTLRYDKDRFSTLNQSTGVYCFDTYVKYVRRKGIKLCGQFHDELVTPLYKTDQEHVREALQASIKQVNDELKLNVQLGISIDFGESYKDIH